MFKLGATGRYDLVICDIDGCLASEHSSDALDLENLAQVAEYNRLAIERRDRPIVTVCSGRPQPFAEAMCRLLGNTEVPCVAENGVWLYDAGTNHYSIDPNISPADLECVYQARKFVLDRYGSRGVTLQPGKEASVTLYHPEPDFLHAIRPELEVEFQQRGWPLRVSMTWFYINCDLRHVSKATGIARLLAATGADPQRTVGIGDTASDLVIAESVALFACPANAADEIKPAAHYISPHAEAAGVVDILQKIL